MFVKITTPKKPLEAEKLFRACWRQGAEITPEIAIEVLKSTNFKTCMVRMLECVTRLTADKQGAFKEAVLSVFHNREQPESVAWLGHKLAKAGGYENELNAIEGKVFENVGLYYKSDATNEGWQVFGARLEESESTQARRNKKIAQAKRAIFTGKKFAVAASIPEYADFSRCDEVIFYGSDLARLQNITFKDGACVRAGGVENLTPAFDVSNCGDVDLASCDLSGFDELCFREGATVRLQRAVLPKRLDVSKCVYADLSSCDLSGVENFDVANVKKVFLDSATHLPGELDFSGCEQVSLPMCNVAHVKKARLKEGVSIFFNHVIGMSDVFDVSKAAFCDLSGCDLRAFDKLSFREGAGVCFEGAKNLPDELDVSKCLRVDFHGLELKQYKEFKFAKGSDIQLNFVGSLPEAVDVSGCEKLKMLFCNLDNVKKLTFKNKAQMEEARVKLPRFWNGELEFSDEKSPSKVQILGRFIKDLARS